MWQRTLLAVAILASGAIEATADETGLASMHAWRREGGRTCMVDHFHYGSSAGLRSRRAAEVAAIRSWVDFTDLEYGSSWARWGRSASRSMRCSRGGGSWGCDASSRPCR